MEAFIYILINPINKEIFYVGCTKKPLEERLKDHYRKIYEARKGDINWNKRLSYLDNLLPHKALIVEIDRCSIHESDLLEKFWIDKYIKNHPLTNQTTGGVGGDTYSMLPKDQKIITKELISKKMKGQKKPEEFAKNLSIKRTGYGNPAAGKTKNPPVVLESTSQIIIFRNSIESNNFFDNKYAWGNLILIAKHNQNHENKHYYRKMYSVNFPQNVGEIKDIVETLLEKEGNCYVYDKHSKKVTIK